MKSIIFLLLFIFSQTIVFGQVENSTIIVKTSGAKLTEGENTTSRILAKLEKGEKLTLLDIILSSGSTSGRYKVDYNGKTGYISDYFIDDKGGELKNIIKALQNEKSLKIDSIENAKDSIENANKVAELDRIRNQKEGWDEKEKEQIRINDSIADAMLLRAKQKSQNRNNNILKERLEKFIKKYGQSNGTRIANGKIWIGMTEEMLLDSWGKPEDINSTVTRYTNRKQYVYGSGQYVYVENGKVEAWQN